MSARCGLFLALAVLLLPSCQHAPAKPIRSGIGDACRDLSKDPRFLGVAGCEWDGGTIPLECPSAQTDADGGLVCHGEITGAVAEAVTHCDVVSALNEEQLVNENGRSRYVSLVAELSGTKLGQLEVELPPDQMPPVNFADARIWGAKARLALPDDRTFVLSKPSTRSAGLVDVVESSIGRTWTCVDAECQRPHGCLSVRLDQQFPDGGLGPATVYVRLSF